MLGHVITIANLTNNNVFKTLTFTVGDVSGIVLLVSGKLKTVGKASVFSFFIPVLVVL